MQSAYIVTGRMVDDRTVVLDEALPLQPARVRVVVEPLETTPRSYPEVMAAIRERQKQRGHQPPTREEVDAELRSERESWDD